MMEAKDESITPAKYLPQKEIEVPHNSSTIFVVVLACIMPLTTILWDIYSIYESEQPELLEDFHSPRFLQQNECVINITLNATSTDEYESYQPPSTMAAIATSLIISFSIGTFSFLLYEAFRQDPIVGKYVYDRKRLTQPTRTPPPLMLSRSLWRGNEESIGNGGKGWYKFFSWLKVRPALFELYFLTLDDDYIRYSQAADAARKEREKRGYISTCKAGCYHNNCCNTIRVRDQDCGDNDEYFVDEDGYVYYPGYRHELGFQHEGENHYEIPRFSPRSGDMIKSSPVNKSTEGSLKNLSLSGSLINSGDKKLKYSIADLYPEDFRDALTKTKSKSSRNLLSVQIDSEDEEPNSAADIKPANLESIPSRQIDTSVHERTASPFEESNVDSSLVSSSDHIKESSHSNVPKEFDADKSLKSKAAGFNLADSIDCTIYDTDESLSKQHKQGSSTSANVSFKYPHRLMTFFLPPGFHNWTNALRFVGEFFFFTKFNRRVAKARGAMFGGAAVISRRQEMRIHEELIVLTPAEEELLRCAGLDTYLMIRFARFGFDVCFYPFLFACATVFPIYLSCDIDKIFQVHSESGEVIASASVNMVIDGFFSLTINRIPPGSWKMYWVVVFNFFLYFFVLRRLWLEWEIIIKLRHRFLSNGDENFHKNPTYLMKYRNSVIVECVPKPQRSDRNIREAFEQLFPGQIANAEMLIDTMELENVLDKRRVFIEKFESAEAKYQYQHWKYYNGQRDCCMKEPAEPKVRRSCCGKNENALKYYKDRIRDYDDFAERDYDKIVESRLNWRDTPSRPESSEGRRSSSSFDFLPDIVREALGMRSSDLFCSTAVVEFKSISAKQSAVQCNLFGESNTFITNEAPDPRDILWSNMFCDHRFIEKRKIIVEFVLVILVLTWGAFVATITNVANTTIDGLKVSNMDMTKFRLYIPTLIISLILLWIPKFLFIFAMRIIKFKSFSQCDEFVIKWNTAFRVTNILFIFFSISLVDAIRCFKDEPERFIQAVALGVLEQSSILLNLIIIATGQETMLQLLQWRSIIKQAVCRPLINFNSKSRRCLNSLNECPPFEQSCIFGYFSPVLSYGLMIGMIYSFMAPVMLGACSFFFWIATKVHTHNALFIYCEPFSGGGKIFYYWNRVVFATLYSSILIFFGILAIKGYYKMGLAFIVIMLLVTIMVDKSITNTFVVNSMNLPIKIARNHDDEEKALIKKSKLKKDGGENFMYRNPMLNHQNWDEKPFRWV